jgi:hypothetical protein
LGNIDVINLTVVRRGGFTSVYFSGLVIAFLPGYEIDGFLGSRKQVEHEHMFTKRTIEAIARLLSTKGIRVE